MTTPNIEELIAKLSYYSGDGVQIDMARQAQRQAADALQSQAERIAELEKQHIERLLRIEAEVDVLVAERDTLRAEVEAERKAEAEMLARRQAAWELRNAERLARGDKPLPERVQLGRGRTQRLSTLLAVAGIAMLASR